MSTVLLLEDDRWLRDSYRRTLEKAGYVVTIATTAEEAMQQIDASLPDVCVVDILLDGHTSLTLLHELQTYVDTQSLPVIACTALSHPVLEEDRLHHYGIVRVLDKQTTTPDTLVTAVREVVS